LQQQQQQRAGRRGAERKAHQRERGRGPHGVWGCRRWRPAGRVGAGRHISKAAESRVVVKRKRQRPRRSVSYLSLQPPLWCPQWSHFLCVRAGRSQYVGKNVTSRQCARGETGGRGAWHYSPVECQLPGCGENAQGDYGRGRSGAADRLLPQRRGAEAFHSLGECAKAEPRHVPLVATGRNTERKKPRESVGCAAHGKHVKPPSAAA